MPDAPHGTGTIKFASSAPRIGSSTLTVSACQFLTIVLLMMKPELVLHASRDTISLMVSVNFLPPTTWLPLMPDVPHGTGIIRSASVALNGGSSMLTEFACPFLTTAQLTMKQVPVLLASRDTTLKKELVFSQLPTP